MFSRSDQFDGIRYIVSFDLIIQDFGCGIAPENLGKLFIDFSKMEDSASLNRNGVGLGLSICKILIEHMAGKVDVKSQVGKGTTFTLTFKTTCKLYREEFLLISNSSSSLYGDL